MNWNMQDFFDIDTNHPFYRLFAESTEIWHLLTNRDAFIKELLAGTYKPALKGKISPHACISGDVYIDEDVIIDEFVTINGPTIILSGTHVRQGAYIRGSCLIGRNCVAGHTSEFKGVVMLDKAKAPHFNYVGDCVLGKNINLGAGTKLSNVKISTGTIAIRMNGETKDTGLKKFSVIMGDNSQTGCNSVINPGSIVERDCLIYPNTSFTGYCKKNTIYKLRQQTQVIERRA